MNYDGPVEFVSLCKALAANDGKVHEAAAMLDAQKAAPDRVKRVLRSASDPGTLADPTWGGALADYRTISSGFLASLRTASVFDRILTDNAFNRIPLRTRVTVSSQALVGSFHSEADMKPVSSLTLDNVTLDPRKVAALVVISAELARMSGGAADSVVTRELQAGCAAAVDGEFLASINAFPGVQSIDGSGSPAPEFLHDLELALALMDIGQRSRLYCVVTPDMMVRLALDSMSLLTADLDATRGGMIGGITILPSDQQVAGTSTVIDASRIVAGADVITARATRQGDVEFNTDPSAGENRLVSLWQTNQVGILVERWVGWSITSASAICEITGTSA